MRLAYTLLLCNKMPLSLDWHKAISIEHLPRFKLDCNDLWNQFGYYLPKQLENNYQWVKKCLSFEHFITFGIFFFFFMSEFLRFSIFIIILHIKLLSFVLIRFLLMWLSAFKCMLLVGFQTNKISQVTSFVLSNNLMPKKHNQI